MKGKGAMVDRPSRGPWLIPVAGVLFAVGATVFAAYSMLKFQNTTIQVSEKKKLDALRARVKELEAVEENFKQIQARITQMTEIAEAIAKGEQQLTDDLTQLARLGQVEEQLKKQLRASRGPAKKKVEAEIAKSAQARAPIATRKAQIEKALVVARRQLAETFRGLASPVQAQTQAPSHAAPSPQLANPAPKNERAPAIPEGEVPAPDSGGAEGGE